MWSLRGSWVSAEALSFLQNKSDQRCWGQVTTGQCSSDAVLYFLDLNLKQALKWKRVRYRPHGKTASLSANSVLVRKMSSRVWIPCESWNSFIRDFFIILFLHGCNINLFFSHSLFKIAIWSRAGSVSFTTSSVMCEGIGGRNIVKFAGPEL